MSRLNVIHKIKEEHVMVHHSASSSFMVRPGGLGTLGSHFSLSLIQSKEISLDLPPFQEAVCKNKI